MVVMDCALSQSATEPLEREGEAAVRACKHFGGLSEAWEYFKSFPVMCYRDYYHSELYYNPLIIRTLCFTFS